MQIPSLPTDNIYKFMALGGIIFFLAGHFASYYSGTRIQELAAQIEQAKAIAEIYAKTDGQKSELVLAEATAAAYEREFLLSERGGIMTFLNLTFWVGLVLSIAGFLLWYFRVQRQLDLMLKAQAEKIRREVQ